MSSNDKEKLDELITKVRALGQRVKSTRTEFGSPLIDRVLERVGRISEKLPQHNGNSHPQQPPQQQPPGRICPRCGVQAVQEARFCSSCAFDFQAQESSERRRRDDEEKLERNAKFGVVS